MHARKTKKPAFLEKLTAAPTVTAAYAALPRKFTQHAPSLYELIRGKTGQQAAYATIRRIQGGEIIRTTIIPEFNDHCVTWTNTEHDGDDQSLNRNILSSMAPPAFSEVTGGDHMDPDDFKYVVEELRRHHERPGALLHHFIKSWEKTLSLVATPTVWRTIDAYAQRLMLQGTVDGFPRDCLSTDNSPVPGLQQALQQALGQRESWLHHDWLAYYVLDDPNDPLIEKFMATPRREDLLKY